LPEIVTHQKTGFLVSSVYEMAGAIRRLDSVRAIDCRREAEVRFSAEMMIDSYLALYEELARGIRTQELPAA
jgi:glycosyltransferase involved in cell wall biosynthesis